MEGVRDNKRHWIEMSKTNYDSRSEDNSGPKDGNSKKSETPNVIEKNDGLLIKRTDSKPMIQTKTADTNLKPSNVLHVNSNGGSHLTSHHPECDIVPKIVGKLGRNESEQLLNCYNQHNGSVISISTDSTTKIDQVNSAEQ